MQEVPQVQEVPRVPEPQVTPMTPKRAEAEKVDLEKDVKASGKTTKPEKELSPEVERTNSYQCYVMSGKGDTPEQKVNEVGKELNYHNMLVVIAVGDKTINNIGSIHTVAEKWGLLYSIIQRAISGVKNTAKVEGSMIKLPGTRKEDLDVSKMNHRPRTNQIKKLHPLKSPRLARERVLGKHQERRFKRRKQKEKAVVVMSYPTYHYEE